MNSPENQSTLTKSVQNLAIVTGASAGIGLVYAQELARQGYSLALCARRVDNLEKLKEELESLYGVQVYTEKVDLLDKAARRRFYQRATKDSKPQLLVNNAGFGSVSKFAETNIERELDMVSLNCQALLDLSHMTFADMREQRSGSIINVASIAAHQPITYMTTYAATKAFVHSFSQALAAEAQDFNVHVMSHCPGPTESEFHLVSGLPEKMNHLPSMTALEVVRQALQAQKGQNWVCINGLKNKFLALTGKVTPGPIAARITKRVLAENVNSKK